MTPNARQTAFDVLNCAEEKNTTLDQALDRQTKAFESLSAKDRNLAHAIVFGVLRHRGRLDHLVRAFSNRPVESVEPAVMTLLRMSLFQILFLDRVPDFAAVNTSIELAKANGQKKSSGFINAVLRQAVQGHSGVALPDPKKQFPAYLNTLYSVPGWLGKRWIKAYGKEKTEALARHLMEIPSLTLRVNTAKISRKDLMQLFSESSIEVEETRYSPVGIHTFHPGQPSDLPGFSQGYFQIQDEAAQLVGVALAPESGDLVLDACAGLGGKTCHVAQAMQGNGKVTAADVEPSKLERLLQEAGRLGLSNIVTQPADIMKTSVSDFEGFFDRVLVDAPCTGLGVLRRNPDTRWKRKSGDILRMAARQKKILNAAAGLVRPGGVLVYAVCSCEPEENEGVTTHFLHKRKDFIPDEGSLTKILPKLAGPGAYDLKTFPDFSAMDGFYLARMRRIQRG